ncbi:MAG: L-serine ammonia-lyase, iron-sulfur-dependent, subunit alpha [Hyphomicrobiales bacterium]
MTLIPPSIFNDVIGPVMRGPSSSHCAAALRIGRLARDLMAGRIERVLLELDSKGSLATTHADQGSDMGLFGGLLGWETWEERLADSASAARDAGIGVDIRIGDFGDPHPNTYRLTLSNCRETHHMIALSTGGGVIEVVEIDQIPLSLTGDRFETLLSVASVGMDLHELLKEAVAADEILLHTGNGRTLIEITGRQPLPESVLTRLASRKEVDWIRALAPVLPILGAKDVRVPFVTCAQMLEWNRDRQLDLAGLAAAYESARGGIPAQEAEDRMLEIVRLLRRSIAHGLQGTRCEDRILGVQSAAFQTGMEKGKLLDAGMLNTMILYATALMEAKSAMAVIVAAPTAGACGALPAAVVAAAEIMGRPEADMARALLAAGIIGVFISARSTFAAEVCGCQAECGAGSGMAAAALATLAGGSAMEAADAASMALQNILGLVCDPVANRVEVPCLGRNVLAVSNALACANMALAGFDPVIPLDEVIDAMDRVGKSLPPELRCTGLGGLAITPASRAIAERLRRKPSS